jgi:hypothetical protein
VVAGLLGQPVHVGQALDHALLCHCMAASTCLKFTVSGISAAVPAELPHTTSGVVWCNRVMWTTDGVQLRRILAWSVAAYDLYVVGPCVV